MPLGRAGLGEILGEFQEKLPIARAKPGRENCEGGMRPPGSNGALTGVANGECHQPDLLRIYFARRRADLLAFIKA
jgi:hypothetical protein